MVAQQVVTGSPPHEGRRRRRPNRKNNKKLKNNETGSGPSEDEEKSLESLEVLVLPDPENKLDVDSTNNKLEDREVIAVTVAQTVEVNKLDVDRTNNKLGDREAISVTAAQTVDIDKPTHRLEIDKEVATMATAQTVDSDKSNHNLDNPEVVVHTTMALGIHDGSLEGGMEGSEPSVLAGIAPAADRGVLDADPTGSTVRESARRVQAALRGQLVRDRVQGGVPVAGTRSSRSGLDTSGQHFEAVTASVDVVGMGPPLVQWNQKLQREVECIEGRRPAIHANRYHEEPVETGFHKTWFLCQVVPPTPECSCPHEMVYYTASVGAEKVEQWFQEQYSQLAQSRGFTRWQRVRWFTSNATVEEAPLSGCRLLPYDEIPHERAVLWGENLTMVIFGAVPTEGPEVQWQLVVADAVARHVQEEVEPRRRGRSWFTAAEMPGAARVPEGFGMVPGADGGEGLLDPSWCLDWLGPELAALDNRREGTVELTAVVEGWTQDSVEGPGTATPNSPDERFSVMVWNAKGVGRQLCSPEGGQGLAQWLRRYNPAVAVIPEGAIPYKPSRKSSKYATALVEFSRKQGYVPYWTHHGNAQAKYAMTILVRAGLEVTETSSSLDLDGIMQREGRVLALRFRTFWVLGMYVPHNEQSWQLLMEQAQAWMQRQNQPVILAADWNAVLDDMQTGIRVHPSGLKTELPRDYLSEEFVGKMHILTQHRHQAMMEWVARCGLTDMAPNGAHTTWFKAGITARGEDVQISTQLQKEVVYPRKRQLVTARIDGVFLNREASEVFRLDQVHGRPVIPARSMTKWAEEETLKQALGSDHFPLLFEFECKEGTYYALPCDAGLEGDAVQERTAILVSSVRKRLFGLMMVARSWLRMRQLLICWRERAPVPPDTVRFRQRWQRVVRRSGRIIPLRYWHMRRLLPSGVPTSTHPEKDWDTAWSRQGLDKYCAAVQEFVERSSWVLDGDQLQARIEKVTAEARQFRLWATTACYTRQYKEAALDEDGRPVPRLCPRMPLRARGTGWKRDHAPCLEYIARVWLWCVVATRVHHWRRSADEAAGRRDGLWPEPGQEDLGVAAVLGSMWGADTPLQKVAVRLLLRTCKPPGQCLNWKGSLPWYLHRSTAGWAETMLYIRMQQPMRMEEDSSEDEAHRRQGEILWQEWRAAVCGSAAISVPWGTWGERDRRPRLAQDLNERLEKKWRCRARLERHMGSVTDSVVPAAVSTVSDERVLQIRANATVSADTSYSQTIDVDEWGLRALVPGCQTAQMPTGRLSGDNRARVNRLMKEGFRSQGGQEQQWFADCKKKSTAHSGLTYTAGHISSSAVGTDKVWCGAQLWDTGSDFNVVSGSMLERLMGPGWRDMVTPLETGRTARMATGAVCRAMGTVVLYMDWTVGPEGDDLTVGGLMEEKAEPWRVVRMPIRFVVFAAFEMPLILGMPTMATMTGGFSWLDGQPAQVKLYKTPPPVDGRRRDETEMYTLPVQMLRPSMPGTLQVCCADEAQWISSTEPQAIKTRLVAGGYRPQVGYFSRKYGWVPEGTPGAIEIPLEYTVEEVQRYSALYSGERRFVTFGSTDAVDIADQLEVMVQGAPVGPREDATIHTGYRRDELSPEVYDELARHPPPHEEIGTDPVYIPAGTPVAWLEAQAVRTVEVQRLIAELEGAGNPWVHLLRPVRSETVQYRGETVQTLQERRDETEVPIKGPDRFRDPRTLAQEMAGMKLSEWIGALDTLWSSMAEATLRAQKWSAEVMYQLLFGLDIATPRVPIQNLWDQVLLAGLLETDVQVGRQQMRQLQKEVARSREQLQRAAELRQWLRQPCRQEWLSRNRQERGPGCPFDAVLLALGRESHTAEGAQLAEEQRMQIQQGLWGSQTTPPSPNAASTDGCDEAWRLDNAARLCLTRAADSDEATELADVKELEAAEMYLGEAMEELAQTVGVEGTVPRGESAARICRLMQRTRKWELTEDEKEAVEAAAKQREELAEKLRTDSAFDNPLESILENPIPIPKYMASEEHLRQAAAQDTVLSVNCSEVMGRLTPYWQKRIREACSQERPARGRRVIDPEARVNRFAGYVASVSLYEIKDEKQRNQVLDLILDLEGFFNCDPNVPPEWTGGEPYSGLTLEKENPPIQHQERRVPPLALPVVLDQIRQWLEAGIVEPSSSPHSSPLLIVAKKPLAPPKDPATGLPVANWNPKPRWRICVDYKTVNSRLSAVNMTNAPRLEVCLHQVASCGGRVFEERRKEEEEGASMEGQSWLATTADLHQGFHQIRLAPQCRPYTAFTVPGLHAKEGHLQFVCAPFGLSVMPTYFHEVVGQAIGDLHYGSKGLVEATNAAAQRPVASHYIDDTFVSTIDSFEGHIAAVHKVFKRLEAVGFGARVDKVEFAKPQLGMLGWTVAEGRITTDRSKVAKLIGNIGGDEDRLRDKKDVMSALGAINFYRSMIPNAGGLSAPLYNLTKKGAFENESDWTPGHSAALRALKRALLSDRFLAVPQEDRGFILATDASAHSGAAVLAQVQPNGAEHPVSYAGTSFPEAARRWSASERECFTLLWGAEYFNQYLRFGKNKFVTDHAPLRALAKAGPRSVNAKLARWSAKLAQWSQATICYRAGVMLGPSDALSRLIYPAKEETADTRQSLVTHKGCWEPLESTDVGPRPGTRLFGLPMQRLSMLKPPTGQVWKAAVKAYEEATPAEQEAAPPLHEEEVLKVAAQEGKEARKRHDWFQDGVITPTLATKIIQHARDIGLQEGITETELGDGSYYVTKWVDTRMLDPSWTAAVADDGITEPLARTISKGEDLVEQLLVWTETGSTLVGQLIHDVTGYWPETEESEYTCFMEQWEPTPETAEYSDDENAAWLDNLELVDAEDNPRDWDWCLRPEGVCRQPLETDDQEQVCVTLEGDEQTTADPLEGVWERVRQKALRMTGEQCRKDGINEGRVPAAMQAYIRALCDPTVTTVVCQGGPGTGKTYTATMVAMLLLAEGAINKLMHTKPLVSAGGQGVGFERGSMQDKLQFWTRPTRQAAERVAQQVGLEAEELQSKTEAWPIDRTRGLSLPCGEWLVADEMQNTQLPLFTCMMQRAEKGAKVVICGDIHQSDLTAGRKTAGMAWMLQAWKELEGRAENSTAENRERAQHRFQELQKSFRYVEMTSQCCMRNAQNSALAQWIREVETTRQTAHQQVKAGKQSAKDKVPKVCVMAQSPDGMVPVYSAFAGADAFGSGVVATCPGAQIVGGSEMDVVAREAFQRKHRFQPFTDQMTVPAHMLQGVYAVVSGAPCVAFSPAGYQLGATDNRGRLYEEQMAAYIEVRVPVIMLEQVPECRKMLHTDTRSQQRGASPQDRVVQQLREAGYHVILGDDGEPGQLCRATDFGGVVDRRRLFTIAVVPEVWEQRGAEFKWPTPSGGARMAQEILSPTPAPQYVRCTDNGEQFVRVQKVAEPGRARQAWQRRNTSNETMGAWDDPNKIYATDGPIPSPTARGNTRWFEYTGPNREEWRRRLSPMEVCKAMGMDPRQVHGLGERSVYRLCGNAVPRELAECMGNCLRQLVIPELARARAQSWVDKYEVESTKVNREATDEQIVEEVLREQMLRRMQQMLVGRVALAGVTIPTPPHGNGMSDDAHHHAPPTDTLMWIGEGAAGSISGQKEVEEYQSRLSAGVERSQWVLTTEGAESLALETDIASILMLEEIAQSMYETETSLNDAYLMTFRDPGIIARREQYAAAQKLCDWCSRLCHYLRRGQHRGGDDKTRRMQTEREAADYCLMEGLLYRRSQRQDGPGLQLCTPSSLRDHVVRMAHDSPMTIHPSAYQMRQSISRRHYWPGIAASCEAYVAGCMTCQQAGRAPKTGSDQTRHVPVGKPLSVVAMDVVGPLGRKSSATTRGNRYIVTLIDWFTRFVVMYPVVEPTAECIGACLMKFVARFGCPMTLLSDNASYFKERAVRALEQHLQVKRAFISAHRPAGNGLLERFHRTLGRALKTRVRDTENVDWDDSLEYLAFGYNTMEHTSTGYSPYYLMHGFHPALPFDVVSPVDEEHFVSKAAWVQEQQRRLNQAHALAFERMQDAGHAQLTRHRNKEVPLLHKGDPVLVFIPAVPRGFVKKCTLRWHGPFEVVSERCGRTYWVQTNNKVRSIHESRLKKALVDRDRTTPEDREITQEFENLMDQGAAAGRGWGNVAQILEQSDVNAGTPMECAEYQDEFAYVLETRPYRTSSQQQKESTEPRLDADGDELSADLERDEAVMEVFTRGCEYTTMCCPACKGECGTPLTTHRSICPACTTWLSLNAAQAQADPQGTGVEEGRWYRIAAPVGEEAAPTSHTENEQRRKCTLCREAMVYVPSTELQQFCVNEGACRRRSTQRVEVTRLLPCTEQFIRVVARGGVAGATTAEESAPWVSERYPVHDGREEAEAAGAIAEDDRIPVDEIEPVPRTDTAEEAAYNIRRVVAHRAAGSAYKVEWEDGTVTAVEVHSMFGSAEAISDYWRSDTGNRRTSELQRRRTRWDGQEAVARFRYEDWSRRACQGYLQAVEIKYVVAVQLKSVRQKTHAAWLQRLRNTGLADTDVYDVWVVPTALYEPTGCAILPILGMRGCHLRTLVSEDEWSGVCGRLRDQFKAVSLNGSVPLFWWHTPEEDSQWGLERSGEDSYPLAEILA
jgi:site-specific DNA-cytosine methylase/exonuclease III